MTQPQREALIDLLHFALLADSHVSLKEDSSLSTAIDNIGWDSPRPRDIHMLNSISRARRATESDEAGSDFIRMRALQFETSESQLEAVTALNTLMSSDGISPEESAFINLLRTNFP
jgi:hypothetical protein